MNNIEKITDILLDNNDLNLSVDQCEQIAELLDENGIGDLQKSKKEINSYTAKINKLNRIVDHLKENLYNEKQAHIDTKIKLNAQAKLADGARPNAAVAAANRGENLQKVIDNIDYWIGGLWVQGYSPSSREVAKALVELGLTVAPCPDNTAALELPKWQLIAENLEEQLEIAEERLKQAQDIVKLNVLKPTDDQEEKEVDKYQITTVLFDDFAAENLDVMELLADAIDLKYPLMGQKYMMFGEYVNRSEKPIT